MEVERRWLVLYLAIAIIMGMILANLFGHVGYDQGIEDGKQKLANELSERFFQEVFDGNYLLIDSLCKSQYYSKEPQQPESREDARFSTGKHDERLIVFNSYNPCKGFSGVYSITLPSDGILRYSECKDSVLSDYNTGFYCELREPQMQESRP